MNLTRLGVARSGLTGFSALLSVIGACFIIGSFLCIRSVRSTSRCIVVIMALADISVALPALLSSIVALLKISSWSNYRLCRIQSLFITTGSQISFIWTAGLAQHMFILVTFRSVEAIKKGLAVLGGLTLLVVMENVYLYYYNILGGMKSIQEEGLGWCWISINNGTSDNCLYLIWDGKLLEITSYVVVFLYYSLLYRRLQDIRREEDLPSGCVTSIIHKTGKIVAIPFVFVLVRLSGTLVSLWFVANQCSRPTSTVFDVFLTLMAFFDVSQGWVNFILYFLTTSKELGGWGERLMLAVRSIPYMTKKRRPHSSQNSCATYNTSRVCNTLSTARVSQNSSILLAESPMGSPAVTRNPVFDERVCGQAKERLLSRDSIPEY